MSSNNEPKCQETAFPRTCWLGWGRRSLRRTLRQSPVPQGIVTAAGELRFANAALQALLGPDSVNRPLNQHLETSRWQALLTRSGDPHPPAEGLRLEGREGRSSWVSLRLCRPTGLHQDEFVMTAWEQTEDRLQHLKTVESAASYRTLLRQSVDLLLWLDKGGHIVGGNDRSKLLLGSQLRGVPLVSLLGSVDRDRVQQALEDCRGAGSVIALRELELHSVEGHQSILVDARLQCGGDQQPALVLTGLSVSHLVGKLKKQRAEGQRHREIFQASSEAMLLLELPGGDIREFNAAFSTLFRYEAKRLRGRREQDLALWTDAAAREATWTAALAQGAAQLADAQMRRADHSQFQGEVRLEPLSIDATPHLLMTVRDTTAICLAASAQAESEEKFRRTFEHSPDGIAVLRLEDGSIHDINPALLAASGYRRADILGQSVYHLGVLPVAAERAEAKEALKRNSSFNNVEFTFKTKSGEQIQALVSGSRFELGGEPHLLTIVRDVRELRQAEKRLRRSEERFRGAFENAQLVMLLMDKNGQVFQSNRFAEELLAYRADELCRMHISMLIAQPERTSLKEALGRLVRSDEGSYVTEQRMVCQNGLEIWTNFQVIRQGEDDDLYFIIQAADITDIKLSQRRMERLAFYDTLTDLANRRLFQERLQHAIEHCERNNTEAALLYLDLDQFKRVNDTLGHEAGDALLREVALRLAECVRTEDTVGRTGGDEFTVLLFNVTSRKDAGTVAAKILSSLREPIKLSGHNLVVTTSIGIASIPADGQDPTMLMKHADLAMYRAKERGRNNYQFFSEDMNTSALVRLQTENELREGLSRGEFVLHYQPKVRITDGAIVGVESLVRWQHPERGLLAPVEFIQVAEETGAIVGLGSWIIEAACEAGHRFALEATEPFVTAVNLSPRQFRDPNLIHHVRRCLRTSGLAPELLQFEITETMLMHDVEAASIIVQRLHELGIQLAIDDFGTGYSSLNYLKKFPIATVKVDRSFVTDIPNNSDDMAITAAVIAMAHRLNMDVVAEGVETEGQLAFLAENQCEFAQGYLFSQPLPEAQILARLGETVHLQRAEKAEQLEDQPPPDSASAPTAAPYAASPRAPVAPTPLNRTGSR